MSRYIILNYRPAYKHLDQMKDDMYCLVSWLDSMEYEIKQYLGEEKWNILQGFILSLGQNFNYVYDILQMIIHRSEEVQK